MSYDPVTSDRLAFFMLKKINRAIRQFDMIRDGDRIAVALSGGKDSFSLLNMLRFRQRSSKDKYDLVALHIVGDARGSEMPPYPHLEEWLRDQGFEYLIRPTLMAQDEQLPMTCQRCTWNRRRTLLEMAGELGCNNLAFGHHLDDLAETALLNLLYHGRNETMRPTREYFGGIKLIRPMCFVPEKEIGKFARTCDLPLPPPPCPVGLHTQRKRMKEIIAGLERECRRVRSNLVRGAMKESTPQSPNSIVEVSKERSNA